MQKKLFELRVTLTHASDNDAALALMDYFATFGEVGDVHRFSALENRSGARCFLVCFREQMDACRAANQLKLRSFAFNGVLVEVRRKA